jgi:thiosulfate/3-mercaptopyruvate sulfurtransferase
MKGSLYVIRNVVAAGLSLCLAGVAPAEAAETAGGYARPELLVETAWLDENLIDPKIIVVDVRERGRYDQIHIPNAQWLDDGRLYSRDGDTPSVLPADQFKELIESVGISDSSHVIAVDEIGGRAAAKLWWALGYHGFDRVSLLNGGYAKWETEGRALTTEYPYSRTGSFTPKPRPERAVTVEQVKEALGKENVVILDARRATEYSGKFRRGLRGGHLPGAHSIPWQENLTPGEDGLIFKPQTELLEIYRKAGVTGESRVIAYGGGGRRSTHLLFTLALIGLNDRGANYVGSWIEWVERPDLPVETPTPRAGSKAKQKGGSEP